MFQHKKTGMAIMLIIVSLIALPLFIHLDKLPIRLWDESRLAVNAQEMYENGDFIVTHFAGEPEMWNTKPPLMIWAQVAFMHVLGINELAVRLPAALAAFTTCLLLIFFSYKAFENYLTGLLAALVLATANGYIHEHISRNGDYDALLTLFTTIYCLCFFLYLQKGQLRYLHLFFLALTFTVLTKSIQGLIFLPVLFVFALQQKKLILLLKNKWLYINTALFLLVGVGYFFLRELVNPGYLQAVWKNDLGGRYTQDLVEGQRPWHYYLHNLIRFDFSYWLPFTLAGFILGLWSKSKSLKAYTGYSLLLICFYLFIISSAQTKVPWYAAPLYPLLSLIAAIGLEKLFMLLMNKLQGNLRWRLMPYLLLVVFLYPYQHIFRKSYNPTDYDWDKDVYPISYILQEADRGIYSLDNHYVCFEDYSVHLLFYINSLNKKGKKIAYTSFDEIREGDIVIAAEPHVKAKIEEKFNYKIARQYYNVQIYLILAQKPVSSGL